MAGPDSTPRDHPAAGRWTALLLAAAIGGCANGYVDVASRLDAGDLAQLASATQQALENNKVGQSSNWVNEANGHLGTVTPTRTFKAGETPCRDFQQTATVEGQTIFAYDTACRTGDGSWRSKNFGSLSQAIRDGDYRRPGYPRRYGYYDPWCRWPYHDPFCDPWYGHGYYGYGPSMRLGYWRRF